MSKRNRKRQKLSVQIFLRYGLVLLCAIVLMGVSSYFIFAKILLDENVMASNAAVVGSGKYIEGYIDKMYAISSLVAGDQKVIDYIESGQEELKDDILADIDIVLKSDKFIESVIIVTYDGRIISSDSSVTMESSPDMMKKSWYVEAIDAMPHLTPTRMNEFTSGRDAWVISLSSEIVSSDGEHLGILLMDIDYRFVQEHLLSMELKEHSEVFIMSSCDELVYHKDTSYFTNTEKIEELQLCALADENYERATNTLTKKYEIENAQWTLVIMTRLTNLVTLRQTLMLAVAVLIVVIGALMLAVSNIFARRITKPIKELQRIMSRHENARMVLDENNRYCEEVNRLAFEYNAMIERIDGLMHENVDKERSLHSMEMQTLTDQINPHFLYNTLDTILWMAETGDSDGVVSMTKTLAQFFRLSLSGGMSMITVRDEIDHVRQYLKIQKMRYGEKLSYRFDVDEAVLNCVVPKIILQPIVENAIYHGIKEKDGPGNIVVGAKIQDGYLRFYVQDDGVGFDTKNVPASSKKLGGVGIGNVDERLKLQYGQDCGVKIDSEIGKGTTVVLTAKCNK